jgi:hypothetical protein
MHPRCRAATRKLIERRFSESDRVHALRIRSIACTDRAGTFGDFPLVMACAAAFVGAATTGSDANGLMTRFWPFWASRFCVHLLISYLIFNRKRATAPRS